MFYFSTAELGRRFKRVHLDVSENTLETEDSYENDISRMFSKHFLEKIRRLAAQARTEVAFRKDPNIPKEKRLAKTFAAFCKRNVNLFCDDVKNMVRTALIAPVYE